MTRISGIDQPIALDAQYLLSLVMLRLGLRRNELDHLQTRPGGEHGKNSQQMIFYMLDTNILRFFINPVEDSHLAQPFRDMLGTDNELRSMVAVITAQYIFSGKLPGQGNSPLFVHPAHWKEFLNFTRNVDAVDELERNAKAFTKNRRNLQVLQDLAGDLESAPSVDAKQKVLARDIRRKITETRLDRAVGLKMAGKLLRKEIPIHNVEAIPVLPKEFWDSCDMRSQNRIDVFRQINLERNSGEPRPDSSLQCDNEVLQLLGRVNRYFNEQEMNARLVLITADSYFSEAIDRAPWPEPANSRDSYLRHVIQYIPILNMRDMENGINSGEATDALRAALDAQLLSDGELDEPAEETDNHFDQMLDAKQAGIRETFRQIIRVYQNDGGVAGQRGKEAVLKDLLARQRAEFPAVFDAARETVYKLWRDVIEAAADVNYTTLIDYYRDNLKELREALRHVDQNDLKAIGEIYLEKQREAYDEMARAHLEARLLAELGAEGTEQWANYNLGIRLTHLKKGTELTRAAGRVIDHLRTQEWHQIARGVEQIGKLEEPVVNLSAAAMAITLQAGQWDAAARIGIYANDLLERRANTIQATDRSLLEARLKLMLVMAHRARLLSDFRDRDGRIYLERAQNALLQLDHVLDEFKTNGLWVEAASAMAERAAMRIAIVLSEFLTHSRAAGKARILQDLANAAVDASSALQLSELPEDPNSKKNSDIVGFAGKPMVASIRARVGVNIVCGNMLARLMDLPMPMLLRDEALRHAGRYISEVLVETDVTWTLFRDYALDGQSPAFEERCASLENKRLLSTFEAEKSLLMAFSKAFAK